MPVSRVPPTAAAGDALWEVLHHESSQKDFDFHIFQLQLERAADRRARAHVSHVLGEDERTAWFRSAKFGMLIHWGAYSLASVEASWPIVRPENWGISEADYFALPKRFNPTHYDPDAFIDLARTVGQKYMVFTTKHHDGFCMFDSSYTDYKITNTPSGKDVIKHLSDACARRAMPLGFYYSPPDLHHPYLRDTSNRHARTGTGSRSAPSCLNISTTWSFNLLSC